MELTEEFLESALLSLKQEILSSLHVAMPGIIQSYDAAAGTAVIQPALRRRVPAERIADNPVADSSVLNGAITPGTVSSGTITHSGGTPSVSESQSERTVTAPLLRDVPVYLPDSSRAVSAGDECLVVFADFCIDGWYETGQPTLPPSPRTHDLSDAFAFVGFRSMPGRAVEG